METQNTHCGEPNLVPGGGSFRRSSRLAAGETGPASGADPRVRSKRAISVKGGIPQPPSRDNPEQATAGLSLLTPNTEVNLPTNGLPRLSQRKGPIKTSKETRYLWKKIDNEDIMRAHYINTKCETENINIVHGTYQQLIKLRPDLKAFSAQNIADRRRYIMRSGKLTKIELNILREEVSRKYTNQQLEIQEEMNADNAVGTRRDGSQLEDVRNAEVTSRRQDDFDSGLFANIERELEKNIISFWGTDPNSRITLPKIHPTRFTFTCINIINEIINQKLDTIKSIETLQLFAYSAVTTVLKMMKVNIGVQQCRNQKPVEPRWKMRIMNRIDHFRSDLSRICEWKRGNTKQILVNRVNQILRNNRINKRDQHFGDKLLMLIDTLKQKIAVLGKRLRRYNKSNKRRHDNRRFKVNQRQFYNHFGENIMVEKTPGIQAVEQFWGSLWSEPVKFDSNAIWVEEEKKSCKGKMNKPVVTVMDIMSVTHGLQNWKAAGPDGIQNFWWKYLTSLHPILASLIGNILNDPTEVPTFLTLGITYLKPKNKETHLPKNYRPITCLSTLYKIISSVIANLITRYISENGILWEEQKGCRRGAKGCKEQLIIDAVITGQVKKTQRNISCAWVDYQKAYDSVPHDWLIEILRIYNIHPSIINVLQTFMSGWRTNLAVNTDNGMLKSKIISINRGIFQGDTLSPLWFCLAINPLSRLLNETNMGFEIRQKKKVLCKINHLLYMDDLKLYAGSRDELCSLINTVARFSMDIQMRFGMDKCATISVHHGELENPKAFDLMLKDLQLPTLGPEESYKYLGFSQSLTKNNRLAKETLRNKLMYRLKKILETELVAGNKIKAINTWSIPALTYSFGIINWSQTDLEAFNRAIRVQLTRFRVHHPRAAIERLYLPRHEGGRGLVELSNLCNKQIIALKRYFYERAENSILHRAIVQSDKNYTPLNLSRKEDLPNIVSHQDRMDDWRSKPLHGRFPHSLSKADKEASLLWLRNGSLFGETEGFIVAIQDQVIQTKNYQKYIEKIPMIDDSCRLCHTHSETIDHLISGCMNLASSEYTKRHNLTANILHQEIAIAYELITREEAIPYYEYRPKPVLENSNVRLYYDIPILTDRTVAANRPDIVLTLFQEKKAFFIDVTHPADGNIDKAESEKISKYIALSEEYRKIYRLTSVDIIPIVITATGLVNRNLKCGIEKLKLCPKTIIAKTQKSVVLETCRIIRTVLNICED